jgi:hypothetical protein
MQVYITFLDKMQHHMLPSMWLPFSQEHSNYHLDDTLSTTFLELIAEAECLISLAELTTKKIPPKATINKPVPTPINNPTTDDGNIMAMFGEKIDDQQDSLNRR